MGLGRILKFVFDISLYIALFIAVILISPGIPPNIKFEPYLLPQARRLDGLLAPNSLLDKAEVLKLDRDIFGPESIAIREDEIFTGIRGGEIIRIKDGKVSTVARTGKCNNEWDERLCGRPLGLRFDPEGKLIVADARVGILQVDVDTGAITTLVSTDDEIEGKKPKFPDDLDVALDGTIYWSDVSTNGFINEILVLALEGPSGRLIKYDPKTKQSKVLINGIHAANGVQLSKTEDFVMVVESFRNRVLRYFLKGPRSGQIDVFVDGLPGMPDNIRPISGKNGYSISIPIPKTSDVPTSFLDWLGPLPLVRKFMLRVQYLLLSVVSLVQKVTSNDYVAQAQYHISNTALGLYHQTSPLKKVIIVEIDEHGNILGSLQNNRGAISDITEANIGPKISYFGSFSKNQIWKISTQNLHLK